MMVYQDHIPLIKLEASDVIICNLHISYQLPIIYQKAGSDIIYCNSTVYEVVNYYSLYPLEPSAIHLKLFMYLIVQYNTTRISLEWSGVWQDFSFLPFSNGDT